VNPAKVGVTRVAFAGIIALGIVFGGAGLYYYTSPQLGAIIAGTSSTTGTQSTSVGNGAGYQDSAGQPAGTWAKFLGYVPKGYVVAPRQSNAPTFPCPPDMSASDCALFQQTCGNGVCDPNESCSTCPIDCGSTGNLICDPYTGRPGQPASICQAIVAGANGG
jgi:hypothetical protein